MEGKRCIRCDQSHPLGMFSIDRHKPDGLNPYCKPCVKEKNAARYISNKEKILAGNKRWREQNRDKAREISRDYRKRNPEAVAAYQKEWRDQHREKSRGYTAKWRAKVGNDRVLADAKAYREANRGKTRAAALKWQKENPGKANAANAARYAAKLMATPVWADLDKIAEFYDEAERMTKEAGIPHEVDHIVPLRSKVVCGLHCEANLRVIPSFDNRSKGNRHWPDMP